MEVFQFFQFFLILLVPGLIGAAAYSIAESLKIKSNVFVALIIDLVTFTSMITGLHFFRHICTSRQLIDAFCYLNFMKNYILLSILIAIVYGVIFGLIRRCFFWIRH